MTVFYKICRSLAKIFGFAAEISLAAMFLVLFLQVILRYFFRIGIIWTDEFSRYLMLWIIMLGAGVMSLDDSHIRITLLEDAFPPSKNWLALLRYLIVGVFSIIFLYYSLNMVKNGFGSISSNMRIPMGYVYLCFPICAGSMALFSLFRSISAVFALFQRGEESGA